LIVSHLSEGAEAVEDLAAIEQASRESEVVVGSKTRHESAIHALSDIGEGRDCHCGDRWEVRGAAGPSVAVELELAAVRRQFRKAIVAGGALLPGLSGIARQRSRRPDADNTGRNDRNDRYHGKHGVSGSSQS
jgi:hypothetical protein